MYNLSYSLYFQVCTSCCTGSYCNQRIPNDELSALELSLLGHSASAPVIEVPYDYILYLPPIVFTTSGPQYDRISVMTSTGLLCENKQSQKKVYLYKVLASSLGKTEYLTSG